MPRKPSLLPYKEKSTNRWILRLPASLSPTGKPKRLPFKTREDAFEKAEQVRKTSDHCERAAREAGPDLIRVAVNADELYRDVYGFEGGLKEAAEVHMRELDERHNSAKLIKLIETYEKNFSRNWGKSHATRWDVLREELAPLESRSVVLLTQDFWRDWLDETAEKRRWADRTFNDYRGLLWSLWNHACTQELASKNPVEGILVRKIGKKKKAVYMIAQVRAVMNCAWEHDREMVPFFALTIFAGLRPDVDGEVGRLIWEDVNFEEQWIRVAANFDNKTETRRFVPMEPNLLLWLKPWEEENGKVLPKNFVKRRRYITRGKYQASPRTPASQWTELVPYGRHVHDITRHTYGSYLEAKYRDRNVVKENMGHADFETYEQHYRNARSPRQGQEFWEIVPPS